MFFEKNHLKTATDKQKTRIWIRQSAEPQRAISR